MLKRFHELLNKIKRNVEEPLMKMSLDSVQGIFEMQDMNKWLKFNAMNENQLENAQNFDIQLESILKKAICSRLPIRKHIAK